MSRYGLILIYFLLALTFIGCGEESHQKEPVDHLEAYEIIDEATLRASNEGSLSGSGRILFVEPLKGMNSKEHYILAGRMLEAGQISLHSHMNGFRQQDGLSLRFEREGSDLHVLSSAPGYPFLEVCHLENVIDENSSFRLRVEVHDGVVAGTRFLIWSDRWSLQGEKQRPLDHITADRALCDSEKQGQVYESSGQGPFWGLEISQATIEFAYREAPFVD